MSKSERQRRRRKPAGAGAGAAKSPAHRVAVEASVRKTMDADLRSMAVMELLATETAVPAVYLRKAAVFLNPARYDDVVEERRLARRCGLPVCGNARPAPLSSKAQQARVVLYHEAEIKSIAEIDRFCCADCRARSAKFRESLSEQPLKMRNLGDPPRLDDVDEAVEEARSNSGGDAASAAGAPNSDIRIVEKSPQTQQAPDEEGAVEAVRAGGSNEGNARDEGDADSDSSLSDTDDEDGMGLFSRPSGDIETIIQQNAFTVVSASLVEWATPETVQWIAGAIECDSVVPASAFVDRIEALVEILRPHLATIFEAFAIPAQHTADIASLVSTFRVLRPLPKLEHAHLLVLAAVLVHGLARRDSGVARLWAGDAGRQVLRTLLGGVMDPDDLAALALTLAP